MSTLKKSTRQLIKYHGRHDGSSPKLRKGLATDLKGERKAHGPKAHKLLRKSKMNEYLRTHSSFKVK